MANFWWRVGLEYLNPLIKVFETMNNDDYGHLEPPLQQIVRSQVRTMTPTKSKISTLEEFEAVDLGTDSLCSLMSHWGQSQPKWAVRATSAFPSIATRQQTSRIGSFVPTTEVALIGRLVLRAS